MWSQSPVMAQISTPLESHWHPNPGVGKRKRSVIDLNKSPAVKDYSDSVISAPPPRIEQMLFEEKNRYFDQTGDAGDWFSPDSKWRIPSIQEVMQDQNHKQQVKYQDGEEVFEASWYLDFYEAQMKAEPIDSEVMVHDLYDPALCPSTPVLQMKQRVEMTYETPGEYGIDSRPNDGTRWQKIAPFPKGKSFMEKKSTPARKFVNLPEVQPIPTAAELRSPAPSPEPRVAFKGIKWNPPPPKVHRGITETIQRRLTRHASIVSSRDISPCSPRRGPSSDLSSAKSMKSMNGIEQIAPLDPGPTPAAIASDTDAHTWAQNQGPTTRPQAYFPGNGPFWENYQDEDYSNHKRPEYMSRTELLAEIEKNKRIFELEIASSRDSWEKDNAEKELAELDAAYVEAADNVAKLERKVELLKSFLSIAASELKGMKEKGTSDVRRLNVAQKEFEKIYSANMAYSAGGNKRKRS
ncbi:hypothetical protein BDV06DRAFT_26448 [Aspergillus oleicola]